MRQLALFILVALVFSCKIKEDSNGALKQRKSIDELVQQYDDKFRMISNENFVSEHIVDSTMILEDFVSFSCYKEIDNHVSCIEIGKQNTTFRSTRYYFIDKVLALAIFHDEITFQIKETGRQYFRNNTLIYQESSVKLPEAQTTLRVADSIRLECSKKLRT